MVRSPVPTRAPSLPSASVKSATSPSRSATRIRSQLRLDLPDLVLQCVAQPGPDGTREHLGLRVISIRPTGGQPEGAKLLTITTREPVVTEANGVVSDTFRLLDWRISTQHAATVGAAVRDPQAGRQPRASREAARAVAADPVQRRPRVLALQDVPRALASGKPGAVPVVRAGVHRRRSQVPRGRQGRVPDPGRRADQPDPRRRGAHRA